MSAMDDSAFRIYAAGFFDGEGSVTIARQRANGLSDYHCIHVTLTQRDKHRGILDRIAALYGGHVNVRRQQTRVKELWAEQAVWQLQHKAKIARFLLDMQPYCIVKERQIAIALEFLQTFTGAPNVSDALGRYQGKVLSADEIERRELLRLAMREANEFGPPKQRSSTLPPLDVRHRQRMLVEPDRSTISRGEARPLAKLTEEDVREIRASYAAKAFTQSELAAMYEVSLMAINKVVNHKAWKHVGPQDTTATGQLSLPDSE